MLERAKLVDGRLIFRLWISLMTRLVDKATVGDQRRPASRRRAPQIAGGSGIRPQKVAQRRRQAPEIIGARKLRADPPGSPSSLREAVLARILARKAFCPQKAPFFACKREWFLARPIEASQLSNIVATLPRRR